MATAPAVAAAPK